MSDLPTVSFLDADLDQLTRGYAVKAYPEGATLAGSPDRWTPYVPAARLDAANKMAGELGQLMVTRDLERDAARMALVVAEGRLDAANLEIARLRGVLSAEPCRACHGTGRYDPYCWCCNELTHDHECPPSVACAHCRGTGKHFHAALTPKEPSDV